LRAVGLAARSCLCVRGLVAGSDDSIVPPEAAYWLGRTLPNCRLDVIHGAGHYWVFGQFGLVLDAVAAAMRG
jgi:pimeloyl-ACP methyl ester carboxylesterase